MLPLDNLNPIQQKTLSLYPTYPKFFNDYKPAQLLVTYDDVNTIEQSLSIPRMTIDDIRIIYPEENKNCSVDYLVNWLGFINRLSNINKPLTELDSVAYMIYKDHKMLYLSDLKIIFEKIMKAEYGTFYGSVDAQRILYAFVQYATERNLLDSKNRVEMQLKNETTKPVKTELQKKMEEIIRNAKTEVSKK